MSTAPLQQPDRRLEAFAPLDPAARDDVPVRPDGLQLRAHRQRPRAGGVRRAGAPAAPALTAPGLRPQHHRRRRQDQRRREGTRRADRRDHRPVHRRLPRGHGRARRGAAGRRAARDRAHAADHRDDRAPDRLRPRLRRRRPRAVLGRQLRRTTASCRAADPTRCSPARASKSRRTSAIPGDFVLWKPSTPDLPGWDSPWGRGRPGWHIECSAMAEAHLGETIDIHAGGVDLQFPHHENEIAQSTCAHGGKVFARFWLHNGMLNFGGSKMSKSLGNVSSCTSCCAQHPPEALRYALLSAHYRQPLDWSDALIEQSRAHARPPVRHAARPRRRRRPTPMRISRSVEAALCDDLNTPRCWPSWRASPARRAGAAIRSTEQAPAEGAAAGAGRDPRPAAADPAAWFARGARDDDARIQALVDERSAAKKARDFARADAIRDQLAARRRAARGHRAGRALDARVSASTCLPARSQRRRSRRQAIAEEFAFFGDWSERYQYLIDLGRKLPPFPDAWKTEENRLQGCQSKVWIVPTGDASQLDFRAISDSAIVSGLVYLALRVYSGRSADEILATEPDYIGDDRPGQAPVADAQQRPGRPAGLHPRHRAAAQARAATARDRARRAGVAAAQPASSALMALSHPARSCRTRSSRSRWAGTSTNSPTIRWHWA